MGFGVTDQFKKEFPDRIFNLGMMEQGTVGIAAGMAMEGLIPIVYSIVNFIAFRALEQIRNDAQAELDRLPVEISTLEKKKHRVREELKAILENYLETIDVFAPAAASESAEDTELFQKIEINEDGSLNPEDLKGMDDKGLDSLLGGESEGATDEDTFNLTDIFSLGAEDEDKKESS